MALPTDRVQVIKQESTALGGDDADAAEWGSNPIEPQEDAIEAAGLYAQDATHRDETVVIWRENERWMAKDPTYGIVELLGASAGSGITAAQHKVLPQLIHYLDEGPGPGYVSGATKTLDDSKWPTLVEWKRQDGTLLIEKTITRSGGGATKKNPTPVVWKLFDTDGTTVLETVSDAITYDAGGEISRVRTYP